MDLRETWCELRPVFLLLHTKKTPTADFRDDEWEKRRCLRREKRESLRLSPASRLSLSHSLSSSASQTVCSVSQILSVGSSFCNDPLDLIVFCRNNRIYLNQVVKVIASISWLRFDCSECRPSLCVHVCRS